MIDYGLNAFLIAYSGLMHLRYSLRRAVDAAGGGDQLNAADRNLLHTLADAADRDCRSLRLDEVAMLAADLRWRVSGNRECTIERASVLVDAITDLMHNAFGNERFVFVPTDRQHFFEQGDLLRFGRPYPFPSVRKDIKSAGTCLALDLNTAAVYHLMRVAEVGMRALAKHLRVKLTHKGRTQPVEWAQWEKVLDGIESAIDQRCVQAGAPNKAKAQAREFYRGLLTELQGFKDVYRNNVMHVRRDYTHSEARAALDSVGAFMRRLATRVRE